MRLRVASLLPAATELVCAVGARDRLVGVSHECDHPAEVRGLPVLTRTRLHAPPDLSAAAIDAQVRALVRDAVSLYEVDDAALEAARPDVVITQDLCAVCAVARADVERALCALARADVRLVSLSPTTLADVLDDVERVGAAVERAEAGRAARAAIEARLAAVAARAPARRPKVLTIEWTAPVMIGGTWMPELVAIAGGEALVTRAGEHAPTLDRDALAALAPDVVVVKPCGFPLARTLGEADAIRAALPLDAWRCPVWLADGNAYFNRPGPRLADSAELLADCLRGDPPPRWAGAVAPLALP